MTIIDITQAPKVRCVVVDTFTGQVIYDGNSSYEANVAYKQMLKQNRKPKYSKFTELLFDGTVNKQSLQDFIPFVPERVRPIYAAVLSNTKIDDGALALAEMYHPEFFTK